MKHVSRETAVGLIRLGEAKVSFLPEQTHIVKLGPPRGYPRAYILDCGYIHPYRMWSPQTGNAYDDRVVWAINRNECEALSALQPQN